MNFNLKSFQAKAMFCFLVASRQICKDGELTFLLILGYISHLHLCLFELRNSIFLLVFLLENDFSWSNKMKTFGTEFPAIRLKRNIYILDMFYGSFSDFYFIFFMVFHSLKNSIFHFPSFMAYYYLASFPRNRTVRIVIWGRDLLTIWFAGQLAIWHCSNGKILAFYGWENTKEQGDDKM